MRPRPFMRKDSKAGTVAISLISVLLGALGSQTLDFIKTRQLTVQDRRAVDEDRVWTESGEMYRQLYAMRGRLTGSLNRHHFAVIDKEYAVAKAKITRVQEPNAMTLEREKRVQETIQQVLRDRGELELLLGWADLVAPEGDDRWEKAIHALLALNRWAPLVPPSTSLPDLDSWRSKELVRAQIVRTAELKSKFTTLLALIKEQRKHIRTKSPVSVHLQSESPASPQRDNAPLEFKFEPQH